jgi:hypothetical protein
MLGILEVRGKLRSCGLSIALNVTVAFGYHISNWLTLQPIPMLQMKEEHNT